MPLTVSLPSPHRTSLPNMELKRMQHTLIWSTCLRVRQYKHGGLQYFIQCSKNTTKWAQKTFKSLHMLSFQLNKPSTFPHSVHLRTHHIPPLSAPENTPHPPTQCTWEHTFMLAPTQQLTCTASTRMAIAVPGAQKFDQNHMIGSPPPADY